MLCNYFCPITGNDEDKWKADVLHYLATALDE